MVVSPLDQGSHAEKSSDEDDDDDDDDALTTASPTTAVSSSSEELPFRRRMPLASPRPLQTVIEDVTATRHSIDITVTPASPTTPTTTTATVRQAEPMFQRRQTAHQLNKLRMDLVAARPRSASHAQVSLHRRSNSKSNHQPTALSVAEKIRLAFDLPTVEAYEGEFQCWLVKSVLLKGCLFLTSQSLCFYAKLPKQSGEIQLSGFLAKKNSKRSNMTYWFVLKDGMLSYYDNPKVSKILILLVHSDDCSRRSSTFHGAASTSSPSLM